MDAEALALRLKGKRSGRQWKCLCPAHEDREPSMIVFDGITAVQVRCLAGCTPDAVITALEQRGLWSDDFGVQAPRQKQGVGAGDRHRELAVAMFEEAVPIAGTMAEKYFYGRDLLGDAWRLGDIRFHPRCPRERATQPAVVVAMRSFVTGAIHAVQRIYLTTRFGAVLKDGAMMLGPAAGCAMQLQPRGSELNIAEGLESALAVIAMGHTPAWALGSASLLQVLPVIAGVERLVIWADHDPINPRTGTRPGGAAAFACAMRWHGAGRSVEVMTPKQERFDAADVWSERCGR